MHFASKGLAVAAVALWTCLAFAPCDGADAREGKIDKKTQKAKKDIQQIIFEEQKIEGKIRRPQLVLIKADQRPAFSPMIMQSFGKNDNTAEFVDQSVIENQPNQNAFQFSGTKVITITART